eukprot:gene13462-biopygen23045
MRRRRRHRSEKDGTAGAVGATKVKKMECMCCAARRCIWSVKRFACFPVPAVPNSVCYHGLTHVPHFWYCRQQSPPPPPLPVAARCSSERRRWAAAAGGGQRRRAVICDADGADVVLAGVVLGLRGAVHRW